MGLFDDVLNPQGVQAQTATSGLFDDVLVPEQHGNTGWGWEEGKANYKAGMGHLLAAAGDAVGLQGLKQYGEEVRDQNTARARYAGAHNTDPGSFKEAEFGGDENGYLAYMRRLALGSAPYMAEAAGYAAADALTGGALTPAILTRYGTTAARTVPLLEGAVKTATEQGVARGLGTVAAKEAAEQSVGRGLARSAMVPAVTYPSSLGDVLSNQYDQAGTYDLGSAAALAAPYAALNVLGVEGMMARGGEVSLLKGLTTDGLKGRVTRGLVGGAETALGEGVNESGQEVMNQAGRVAVDSDASMTSPEAMERYLESFIGGAMLGGAMGGVHGGLSSRGYTKAEQADLLQKGDARDQREIDATSDMYAQQRLAELGTPAADYTTQDRINTMTGVSQDRPARTAEDMIAAMQGHVVGKVGDYDMTLWDQYQVDNHVVPADMKAATIGKVGDREVNAWEQYAADNGLSLDLKAEKKAAAKAAKDAKAGNTATAATNNPATPAGATLTTGGVNPGAPAQGPIAEEAPAKITDPVDLTRSAYGIEANNKGVRALIAAANEHLDAGTLPPELYDGLMKSFAASLVGKDGAKLNWRATDKVVRRLGADLGKLVANKTPPAAPVAAYDPTAPGPVTITRPGETPVAGSTQVGEAIPAPTAPVPGVDSVAKEVIQSLPPQQRQVFDLVAAAAKSHELDKYIGEDGTWSPTEIGKSLGISRQSAQRAIAVVRAKLDKAFGGSVKEALKARTNAIRTVESSDYDNLGLSPELQDSRTVSADELFGSENGAEASMGTVETVGGSQSEVGKNEQPSQQYAEKVDPVYEARVREVEARRAAQEDFVLSSPEAQEAAADWDDQRSDGAPTAAELTKKDAYEWVLTYWEWKNGDITQETLAAEQRDMERRYDPRDGRTPAINGRTEGAETESVDSIRAKTAGADQPRLGRDEEKAGVVSENARAAANKERQQFLDEVRQSYNEDLQEGDAPLEHLHEDLQEQYIDVYSQHAEGQISAKELMRQFGRIADEAKTRGITAGRNDTRRLEGGQDSGRVLGRPEQVAQGVGKEVRTGNPTQNRALSEKATVQNTREPTGSTESETAQKADEVPGSNASDKAGVDTNASGTGREGKSVRSDGAGASGKAANPIEARVAELKKKHPKLANRVDRFVARYADGDIDLQRLNDELDTIDEAPTETTVRRSENSALSENASTSGTTAANLTENLKGLFLTPKAFNQRVKVVQSVTEIPANVRDEAQLSENDATTQGFAMPDGTVWMIADHIAPGSELGVLLHELGVHVGFENLLGTENFVKLVQQIFEWAGKNDGSLESKIAKRAVARVQAAEYNARDEGRPFEDADLVHETAAYFVEEAVNAGVNPTALHTIKSEPLRSWFQRVIAAINGALAKMGLKRFDKLTARDIVDLAYGAANLELKAAHSRANKNNVRFSRNSGVVAEDMPGAGSWERAGKAIDAFWRDPVASVKTFGLGALTLAQLGERMRKHNPLISDYIKVSQNMQSTEKHWVQKAAKIDQQWADVADKAELHNLMREARRAGFDPAENVAPKTEEESQLLDRFNALSEPAQKVYTQARDYYAEMRTARQNIVLEMLDDSYKERLETARKSGDTKALRKIEAELRKERGDLESEYKKVKGPYFPQMRLGGFYTVAMSQEMADLMNKEDKSPADIKRIGEMKADEKHYSVSSYDRRSQGLRAEKELRNRYDVVNFHVAAEKNYATATLSVAGMKSVEKYIHNNFSNEVAGKIRDMMAELYFDSLPENHDLKRQMRSENVHGEETDMRRVFAVSATAASHRISRLQFADKLKGAMRDMMEYGKKNGEQAENVYNEIAKRAKLTMDSTRNPFVDKLVTASYLAHLGMNPAFVLTNATQVPMITLPWLAARSNTGAAAAAISNATGRAVDIIKTSWSDQGWRFELDWKGKVTEEEAAMLNDMLERNLLDITIEHDLGAVAEMRNHKIGDALKMANLPVHVTELGNRLVTALAAFEIGKQEGTKGKGDSAHDFVAKAISETQLDYSALNAPRHMQRVMGSASLAKVMMQFRKYQQGMLYLVGSSIYDSVKGESAEVKAVARKQLLGLGFTMGTMAGTQGLPLVGSLAWVADMVAKIFGDDDDPWDTETEFKNWLAETFGQDNAVLIAKGLPAWFGVDMSGRVGMQDLASPLPYVRDGRTVRESAGNAMIAAGGAPVGTMVDMAEGFGLVMGGEWAKGAEKIIPLKLAQNVIKAGRYSVDGMTKQNGEVILPADSFDPLAIGLKGAGFASTKESLYYEGNTAMQKAKAAAMDRREKLLNKYAQAKMGNEDTTDIMEDIKDFNGRHPEKGVRIDASTRLKSLQQRRKNLHSRGDSGILVDRRTKPFASEAEFAFSER